MKCDQGCWQNNKITSNVQNSNEGIIRHDGIHSKKLKLYENSENWAIIKIAIIKLAQ